MKLPRVPEAVKIEGAFFVGVLGIVVVCAILFLELAPTSDAGLVYGPDALRVLSVARPIRSDTTAQSERLTVRYADLTKLCLYAMTLRARHERRGQFVLVLSFLLLLCSCILLRRDSRTDEVPANPLGSCPARSDKDSCHKSPLGVFLHPVLWMAVIGIACGAIAYTSEDGHAQGEQFRLMSTKTALLWFVCIACIVSSVLFLVANLLRQWRSVRSPSAR